MEGGTKSEAEFAYYSPALILLYCDSKVIYRNKSLLFEKVREEGALIREGACVTLYPGG